MSHPERGPESWRPPTPLPGPIWTPRLEVRRYREGDAAQLFEAVDASREALLPWMQWAAQEHRSPQDSLRTIQFFLKEYGRVGAGEGGGAPYGIFDRKDGSLLGGTGFHEFDAAHAATSIGYWTRADVRRQGMCVEATRGLITDAFTRWGLRRISLTCSTENAGSRAVVDRLALRLEGIRLGARWDGPELGWTDQMEFAVRVDEWDATTGRGPGGASW